MNALFEYKNINMFFLAVRSLSGEGNFNWRFIFPFDYLRYEDRLTYPQKETFELEPETVKMPCELVLQVWDAELVRSDNFLGKFHSFNLFLQIKIKLFSWPAHYDRFSRYQCIFSGILGF